MKTVLVNIGASDIINKDNTEIINSNRQLNCHKKC